MLDPKRVSGPLTPVLTIFKRDLSLDLDALRRNVQHLIAKGMGRGAGVLLAVGAGGEFPSLSHEERERVAEAIVEEAAGSVPVFVGVQHTDPRAAIELAKHAEKIGADGIQASPPFYYNPSESDVFDHFKAINDSVPLPIMVYNTYWEGFNITCDLLERLIKLQNIICVKWSAPSMYEYKRAFMLYGKETVFIDNTASPLLSHLLGARGFISHESNFWPEHELRLWDHLEKGSYREAGEMISRLNWPFYDFRARIGARKGGEAHVIKAAMDLAGLAGGPTRPPTAPLSPAERAELKEILTKAGLPSASGA